MYKSTLRAIMVVINHLAKRGKLDSDEHSALQKAVRTLQHAINIKDINLIEKAVSKIAKLLLKSRAGQP